MLTYSRSPYSRTKLKMNPRHFSSHNRRNSGSLVSSARSNAESKINSPSSILPPGSHSICMKNSELSPSSDSSEIAFSSSPIRAA